MRAHAGRASGPGLAHGRDPDRRSVRLHGPRPHAHVGEAKAPAFERHAVLAPGAAQDLEPLVHPRDALGARDAEGGELRVNVAHAGAEHHPSAREVVEHRQVLGELQRVAEREQQDVLTDRDALGDGGDRAAHRDRRGQIAVLDEMVLGEPDVVEAEPVDQRDLLERPGVELARRDLAPRRVAEVVEHAEAQRLGHRGASPSSAAR